MKGAIALLLILAAHSFAVGDDIAPSALAHRCMPHETFAPDCAP